MTVKIEDIREGDEVRLKHSGLTWWIVAGPRKRNCGLFEVAVWNDDYGYEVADIVELERVS